MKSKMHKLNIINFSTRNVLLHSLILYLKHKTKLVIMGEKTERKRTTGDHGKPRETTGKKSEYQLGFPAHSKFDTLNRSRKDDDIRRDRKKAKSICKTYT